MYIDNGIIKEIINLKYRNDIYRASSLTGHPISLGMMSLIMIIYSMKNNKNKLFILIFITSLILSGSRLPLFLLFVYAIYSCKDYLFLNIRLKYLYIFFIPFFVLFAINSSQSLGNKESTSVRYQGMKFVFNTLGSNTDYLVIGSSIGSYGNFNSFKGEEISPIYKKNNFPSKYLELVNTSSGTESFIFNSILELGIFASLIYYSLIVSFFLKLKDGVVITIIAFIYMFFYPLYTLPYFFLTYVMLERKK
jgi:hypothetical protein